MIAYFADLAIIVIAADEGCQPQTWQSLKFAQVPPLPECICQFDGRSA